MPIDVKWEDEQHRVVWVVHSGKWTWDEYHQTNQEILSKLKDIGHNISVVVDTGTGSYMPPNALSNLRKNPLMRHSQVERIVIIIQHRFIQIMAQMVSRLVDFGTNPPKFVTSAEQARKATESARVTEAKT
jgi:hypothetical protein